MRCLFSHQSKNIFRQSVTLLQRLIMEVLTAIVNGFKQLAIAINGFILDVAGVLDPPLNIVSFKIPLNKSSLGFYLGFYWGFNHKLNHSFLERLRNQTSTQFYL